MAFPIVQSHASGAYAADGTSAFTVTYPSGVQPKDLLVLTVNVAGSGIAVSKAGWTSVINSGRTQILSRVVDGSEGASGAFTEASDSSCAWIVDRISGASGVIEASSVVVAVTNTPDPPSLTASSTLDTLWLAAAGSRSDYLGGGPSGMASVLANSTTDGVGLASIASASASYNPATFSVYSTRSCWAVTLAIFPSTDQTVTSVGGIVSAEAFGQSAAVYTFRSVGGVGGIASEEAFGQSAVASLRGVVLPASPIFAGTGAWTIAVVAKWAGGVDGRLFSVWDASHNEIVSLTLDDVSCTISRHTGGTTDTVTGPPADGAFHLYIATYDGVTLRLTRDALTAGPAVASSVSLPSVSGMAIGFGPNGIGALAGTVDDTAIFDFALTASEQAGLVTSSVSTGVNVVHDSSGSSITLVGWQPYAYPPGYAANGAVTSALALAAAGGSIAVPIVVTGKMALRAVELWNTDSATARAWNWHLFAQTQQTAANNVLAQVAAGVAPDAFTPGAASKRTIAASGAPVFLAPGVYWLVIQNTHATSTFGIGSQDSGTLSHNRAQTKTLTVPVGATLDLVAATWTKWDDPIAVVLEGDVFGQTAAF